jgi:hypothetical protein
MAPASRIAKRTGFSRSFALGRGLHRDRVSAGNRETAVSLREKIWNDTTSLDVIAAYLDHLAPGERLAETRSLSRRDQRRLYQRAAGARPLTLDDLVGSDVAPRTEVIHNGRNSLPLPASLRLFQKRFSKPEKGEGRLFGYNETPPLVRLLGPGCFVALPTFGKSAWEARGGVVVDYYQVPDGPVPAGWPKVIPNSQGLQYFVYNKTRDYLRRVSSHVTVGAAYKGETALDHYFMLCREG